MTSEQQLDVVLKCLDAKKKTLRVVESLLETYRLILQKARASDLSEQGLQDAFDLATLSFVATVKPLLLGGDGADPAPVLRPCVCAPEAEPADFDYQPGPWTSGRNILVLGDFNAGLYQPEDGAGNVLLGLWVFASPDASVTTQANVNLCLSAPVLASQIRAILSLATRVLTSDAAHLTADTREWMQTIVESARDALAYARNDRFTIAENPPEKQ